MRRWIVLATLASCGGAPVSPIAAAPEVDEELEDVTVAASPPVCTPTPEEPDRAVAEAFARATELYAEHLRALAAFDAVRTDAEFVEFIRSTEDLMQKTYHAFEIIGQEAEGRWPLAALVRQGQLADFRVSMVKTALAAGHISENAAGYGVPEFWRIERNVAWNMALELAGAQCIDNGWSRWLQRHRGSTARHSPCPQRDDTSEYLDLPESFVVSLESDFDRRLRSFRMSLAPNTSSEARAFSDELAKRSVEFLARVGALRRTFVGPRMEGVRRLEARIYDNWAEALEDIPVPKVLMILSEPYSARSMLRRWEKYRDAEVQRLRDEAASTRKRAAQIPSCDE